jgi:hypothetical protein
MRKWQWLLMGMRAAPWARCDAPGEEQHRALVVALARALRIAQTEVNLRLSERSSIHTSK